MNAYTLDRVLERVPEHAALTDQLDRLSQIDLPPAGAQPPRALLAGWLLDLVEEGKSPTPKALLAEAKSANDASQVREAARGAIDDARHHLTGRLQQLGTSDGVFEVMASDLAEIVTAARALEPLSEIATADDALEHDRRDAYIAWTGLAQRYAELRRVQMKLMVDISGEHRPKHALALFVADPVQVLSEYATWVEGGNVIPPWPLVEPTSTTYGATTANTGHRTVPNDAVTARWLAWAVESGAALAVPTPAEYRTKVDALADPWAGVDEKTANGRVDYSTGAVTLESGHIFLGATR